MLFALAVDRGPNGSQELGIGGARAQLVAEGHLGVVKQAHLDVAVGREPQPRAGAAEVVGHGRDEPHRPAAGVAGKPVVFGRVAGLCGDKLERRAHALLNRVAQLRVGHHFLLLPAVAAKRHVLDEADLDRVVAREVDKVDHLVVVDAAHDDHVELDAGDPEALGRLQGPQHGAEALLGAPREQRELGGYQRVEGEVERGEAVLRHEGQFAVQREAVRRDADLLEPRQRVQPRHEVNEVAAQGGLAAREPDLGDALVDKQTRQAQDLGRREQVFGGRELDPVGRHAIDAWCC